MKLKQMLTYGLAVIALVAGGLTYWGSSFATKMVHDQLVEQKIFFPATEAEGLYPDLKTYAGQQVDSGAKARAYSDLYIKRHIQKATGGKTYSEISTEFRKNPKDPKLAQMRETAFMGETLRGILLNAWGWGLVGQIAFYASLALFAGAATLAAVGVSGLLDENKKTSPSASRAKRKK